MIRNRLSRSAKRKRPFLWVLLFFIAITSILLFVNWDKWFGDLPEPDYQLSNVPQRVFLLPGADGVKERTLTWVSGDSIDMTLQLLGLRSGLLTLRVPHIQKVTTGGGNTYVYSARLTEMVDDDLVQYSIKTKGSQRTLYSNIFNLYPVDASSQDFVLVGDIQDKSPSGTDTFIDAVSRKLPGADAWLFVGDQIERPHDRFWSLFYHDVQSIAGRIPFIPATGNHEYEMGLNFDLGDRWPYIFSTPQNGPNTPEGVSYYVDYPHVRIVVIDTNIYAWYFSTINEWLEGVLAERKDNPFLIVMGHHPIFSVRKGRHNYTVNLALKPLLEKYKVHLYIAGHDHAYSRNEELGVHYLVSTSSAKSYPVGDPEAHIVSRSGARYYSSLHVTQDSLCIKSYAIDELTPFDSLVIVK